ncbi:hypothetical protein CI109_106304 [Kwoniella shandongensis]|uniref:Uncharacterized protein n=1 Tax=Kwoniella shandongensis TaxID=1734106 RepID=A0A5M6BPX6_9TREE|nr:uncharacterized protein CI109_006748 [Kwoniella shandongensis]KAA5524948.1 hypothetical protein CI109_006748 [Kwoniella shandongensis]
MKLTAALAAFAALAPSPVVSSTTTESDALKPLTITTDGINATFIGYGARLTHLYVDDKKGDPRDVVVGYDDPVLYTNESANHFFGAIVGRYANRIKNGSFELDGKNYDIPKNEHDGLNTLHGGTVGYDHRNWSVAQYNTTSITYSLLDSDGFQGFPGILQIYVTYAVLANPPRLTTRIVAIPLDQNTPVMMSTHIYWNVGSFTSANILKDTLYMPYSDRVIPGDSILIPTGQLQSVKYPWTSPAVPLNFTGERPIGDGNGQQCGAGCDGIDNAFILDRPSAEAAESTVLQLYSADTGIRMKVRTNMGGLQLYNCAGMDGTVPLKGDQKQNGLEYIEKYGCLVIEPQDWIDGINHPEWGRRKEQIFGPDTRVSENWAQYEFSTE